MRTSSLEVRPANLLTPTERGYSTIFSSRGMRWNGLQIELGFQPQPDFPFSIEEAEPRDYCVLSATEISWSAKGAGHKARWRPGTTIFLKDRYRIDDLFMIGADSINVQLEDSKLSELQHDEIRASRVDFMEHVIARDEQVAGMLSAMLAEARAGNPAGDLFSQSISLALLAHVYDRYDRSKAAHRVEGRLSQRQIDIVSRYVREHIAYDLSIVGLARLLQLSPAYFCKAFSKTLGVTPHRFVVSERISIARERLRTPSAPPLVEIALGLGFADQAHFSNVFRNLVGCSPSEFRRRGK
jgi:AraC family transcriptional regulator